jgi:hypothetical protein
MAGKSKYRGVFKTNEHGWEYWVAQLIVNKTVYRKRTKDEEHAARKYDIMRMQHGMAPVNFDEEEYFYARRASFYQK